MVYLVDEWEGMPTESEEMAPHWFNISEIPYENMWSDDTYWLPKILKGQFIKADVYFDKDQQVSKFKLNSD